jgi:hypothetical protein
MAQGARLLRISFSSPDFLVLHGRGWGCNKRRKRPGRIPGPARCEIGKGVASENQGSHAAEGTDRSDEVLETLAGVGDLGLHAGLLGAIHVQAGGQIRPAIAAGVEAARVDHALAFRAAAFALGGDLGVELHKVGGGLGPQGHGGNQSNVHTKATVRNGGRFPSSLFFPARSGTASRTEGSPSATQATDPLPAPLVPLHY